MPKPGPSTTGPSLTTREAGAQFAGLITESGGELPAEAETTAAPPVEAAKPVAPETPPPPETSDSETETTPDDQTVYTIPVDGEETEVTLRELKDSFAYKGHNTRKAQELAEQEKRLEPELRARLEAEVAGERAQYAASLQQLAQALEQLQGEPDWPTLRQQLEPAEFLKQKADWEASKAQTERLKQEQARVQAQQEAERWKQFQAHVRAEQDKLKAAVPEWTDPEKAKVEAAKLRAHAKTYGFTDQEIDGVTDHRTLLLLRDAMQYRELQRAPSAKTQAKVAPIRTAKPGTAPPPPPPNAQLDKLVEQAAKTGGLRDAAKAIEALLTERE